jgi:ABC-type transport system involved in cytochrome c biogenesis permease subunit
MRIDEFFFYAALGGYLLGALYYLLHVVRPNLRIGMVATGATLAGFAAHSLSHVFRVYALKRPPFISPYESLSFLAWAIVLIYLVIELRYHNRIMGAFVLPLAVLAGSAAAALPRRIAELAPTLQGVGLWSHVALALFGNAAFALTFCAGVMYLMQERQLKSRHPGRMYFRLLTLALISGSLWAEHARGSFFTWRPREVWSVVSWVIYAGLLYARVSVGWRGRKAAILAILGFCLVLITFIGVKVIKSGQLM